MSRERVLALLRERPGEYLSGEAMSRTLGISRAGAYELARSREFPSMKVGSRIIIPKDKFLLWIEKQCGEGWHPPCGTGEMYE